MRTNANISESKAVIYTVATESTTHGVANMIKTHRTSVRIFWLCVFLGSLSGCTFFITNSIKDYLQYPVVTTVEVYNEVFSPFPAISICNLNTFQTPEGVAFVKQLLEANNLSSYLNATTLKDSNLYSEIREILYFLNANAYINPNRRNFSYPLDQIMTSCRYNFITCTPDEFEWFYHPLYGNCYTFNAASTAIATDTSKLFGFAFEIFIGTPNTTTSTSLVSNTGLQVVIHNQSYTPTPFEGIETSIGIQADIAIDRTFSEKLPAPYNDCVEHTNVISDAFDSVLYKV